MRILLIKTLLLFFYLPCLAQEHNYVRYDTKDGLAGSVVYDMVQDRDGFLWFATETGVSRFDGTHFRNFTVADGLPDNEIIGLFVDSRNRIWMMPFSSAICYYLDGKIYTSKNDSTIRKLTMKSFARFTLENKAGEIAIVQDSKISILKPDGSMHHFTGTADKPLQASAGSGLNNDKFVFSMAQAGMLTIYEYRDDSFHLLDSWSVLSGRYPIHLSNDLVVISDQTNDYIEGTTTAGVFRMPFAGFLKTERLNDSIIINCWSTHVELYNIYRQRSERVLFAAKNLNDFLEDSEGNWWFSSMGSGIYRLPSTDIKNYFFKRGNDYFPVMALEKYRDTLYVGTDNFRYWKVDLNSHRQQDFEIAKGRSPGKVTTINRMPNGIILAGTETGMYNLSTRKMERMLYMSAVKSTHAHGDTLLIGTSWASYGVDSRTMEVVDTFHTARNTAVWKQGNNLYIGTLNGLNVLDEQKKARHLGGVHPALGGKISAIRGGSDGIIWVGTYGNGIIGIKNNQLVATLTTDNGLSSNTCRTIYIKDNILWVGTDKGLNKVAYDGKKFSIKKYTVSDGLASDIINAVFHDGKTIFIGTPAGVTFFEEEKIITRSMCRLKITGIQTPRQRFLHDTTGLHFDHFENNVRIEFSGITFKSGGDILYRYRLKGLDDAWLETRDNFLNFLSLPSGDYEFELSAVNKFGVQSETVHLHFSVAKLIYEKNWFRALVIILLAAAVWFFVRYRIRKIRQQTARNADTARKIAELEQMALKAQMNPHFIFNSLHSIQQYVIDKDVAGANKYISDFARLIRLTLDISSQAKISLSDEINYISTYLALEKAKYEGKFDYEVRVADDIDVYSIFIPAMLLQPYIENSIRHGIYYRTDKNGMITITFSIQNEYLVCIVHDNGVGRKASEQFNSGRVSTHQSKGMLLTARRIEMLNEQYVMPIFTSIEDVTDNESAKKITGTRVVLRFPIQEVKMQA